MKIILRISRTARDTKKAYLQDIPFDTTWLAANEENATIATALSFINAHAATGGTDAAGDTDSEAGTNTADGTDASGTAGIRIRDAEGHAVSPVAWDCSCLQRRCGACAMVIDGVPRLACDARLSAFAKKQRVTVEPLKKFPIIEDLIVDRSVMFENLKRLKLWREARGEKAPHTDISEPAVPADKNRALMRCREALYEGSRCLQCGLCLEVCPNFHAEGHFFGTASAVPASRIFALEKTQAAPADTSPSPASTSHDAPSAESGTGNRNRTLRADYRAHVFEGCGKSLACRNICPAGIDIDSVLARNAHDAVWRPG